METLQTFTDYVLLKQHFIKYPFIWKEGNRYTKISTSALRKRNDFAFFQKFHDAYSSRRERNEHLISAFLSDPSVWIGKMFDDAIMEKHQDRMRRCGSLEYTFEKECEDIEWFLIDNTMKLSKLLLTKGTNHPIIITSREDIPVSWETLSLLNYFQGFIDVWFPLDPLWKTRRMLLSKYHHVLWLNERRHDKMKKCYHQLAHISVDTRSATT